MTENELALQSILQRYFAGIDSSREVADIARKVADGSATYAEVFQVARAHGRILSRSLKENLPEVLTDGKLLWETAQEVIKPPMIASAGEVAKAAASVQESLNAEAGIGIGFIEPKPNLNQIDGIIAGLCDAESYTDGESTFLNRVGNYLEGYVDDCVHDNAKFQYEAGLSPKIERKAMANCCPWCSALAGTYEYSKVSNTGNDVFRRHRNCHCLITFNPADGSKKRQNVHTKSWTDEGKADRIRLAEAIPAKTDIDKAIAADIERTRWEKVNPNRMERLQNGFSAFPENDVLNQYAKQVKPLEGYFDVAMHGSPDAVGFGTKEPNMKASDLAKIIRRDEKYNGGPVRLLCCETGRQVNGEYCFAEELSNALGVPVKAPDEKLYFVSDGTLYIGEFQTGGFRDFTPNERKRMR